MCAGRLYSEGWIFVWAHGKWVVAWTGKPSPWRILEIVLSIQNVILTQNLLHLSEILEPLLVAVHACATAHSPEY